MSAVLVLAATPSRTARVQASDEKPREANASLFVTEPLLGFISASNSLELRPILGIPGGATIGDPVPLPDNLTQLYVAPRHRYALVELDGEASIGVVQLGATVVGTPISVSGALPSADIIAFSPFGRSVALYSEQVGHIQVLTEVPDNAQVSHDLDVRSLGLRPQVLAVSDDGQSLLIGTDDGRLYLAPSNDALRLLYSGGELGGGVFPAWSP